MAASLAQDGRGPSPLCPLVSAHIPRVGRPRHQKHAPASLGKRESRPGPRGVWRGRNHQVSSRWGGSQGRAEGWHSMQNWRYWGTCGWAEGFWVPDPGRDWVRVPGARAGPEAPGEGHWLWCRYQAPKQMLSAIRAASTPSCMPWACPREMGGNVPNMASILRVSREQRVQAASRAGGPADDNLFHGSYAYGTAPASESTRTFPRNKQ